MDVNKMPTTGSQPNITISWQEQPYSENLARENTGEASVLLKRNSYRIYIYTFYIILIMSTIIIVTSVYIYNSTEIIIPVNQANSDTANQYATMKDCMLISPLTKDWYYPMLYNPRYACEPFKIVTDINIQPLRIRGHECNDTDHCYDLIRAYLNIMEQHSKFGYFIDSEANVYNGRRWVCQFWAGQIWVAVMVDVFGAAPQTEKDRVLRNFKEGVIPHKKQCSLNVSELQIHYIDEIVI